MTLVDWWFLKYQRHLHFHWQNMKVKVDMHFNRRRNLTSFFFHFLAFSYYFHFFLPPPGPFCHPSPSKERDWVVCATVRKKERKKERKREREREERWKICYASLKSVSPTPEGGNYCCLIFLPFSPHGVTMRMFAQPYCTFDTTITNHR